MMHAAFPRKIDRKGMKRSAREALKGKLWPLRAVLITYAVALMLCYARPTLFDLIVGKTGVAAANFPAAEALGVWPKNPWLYMASLLVTNIGWLLFAMLYYEFAYLLLRVFRRETVRSADFFGGATKMLGRKLGTWLWARLWQFLWAPLANLTLTVTCAKLLFGAPLPRSVYLLVVSIGFLSTCVGITRMLAYSGAVYLIREFPQVTVRQALRLSIRMTRGYLWQMLLFLLSFFGWLFLAMSAGVIAILVSGSTIANWLLTGAGALLIIPYFETAAAGLYEELKRRALASGAISKADLAQPIAKKVH